jgi:hypothetical protein
MQNASNRNDDYNNDKRVEETNKQLCFEHSSDGSNASKYAPIEIGSRMQIDSGPDTTKEGQQPACEEWQI